MKLEKIVSLGNLKTRIPLLAMIRSLRATGCHLPVLVIPYDNDRFELPENCLWWENSSFKQWLEQNTVPGHARGVMRKYQCLLEDFYQFVDTDIIFLRNPEEVLLPVAGFVTSCLHWSNPEHTYTLESRALLRAASTLWCARVFNSGQFACDRPLFTLESLAAAATSSSNRKTVLDNPHHEQAGMNLLVHESGVPVVNLTLPPHSMESTWAGDYQTSPHRRWAEPGCKPYLIHWAGAKPDGSRQIDELFFSHLGPQERQEWMDALTVQSPTVPSRLRAKLRAAVAAWRSS